MSSQPKTSPRFRGLAGTTSDPFAAYEHKQIAVRVFDPRGSELLMVKKLIEAEEV